MFPQFIDEGPATFHARAFDTAPLQRGAAMWVPTLDATKTLVLGSSQAEDTIDTDYLATAGIGLTKRRTGGGAVLVSNADLVWFDIVIDRSHPQWRDDVVHSFDWVGIATQKALASLGIGTEIHTGRLQSSAWSTQVCFAGLGPGELVVNKGGARKKVVGISQRRTRDRARFQVAILKRWSGAEHAALLTAADPATAATLDEAATGIAVRTSAVIGRVAKALG